jgi:hypothetical protein
MQQKLGADDAILFGSPGLVPLKRKDQIVAERPRLQHAHLFLKRVRSKAGWR